MIEFAIYSLPVLRGTLAISPMPGRTRHYGTDRDHLFRWAPDLVITMTTLAELAKKGSAGLPEDLMAIGVGWEHFPTDDFGVPAADMDEHWQALSGKARQVLEGGGRVLVHCFGGCGRSGMTCLRIMIDAGEDPASALARLRNVRPCAIETDAQMQWAMRL